MTPHVTDITTLNNSPRKIEEKCAKDKTLDKVVCFIFLLSLFPSHCRESLRYITPYLSIFLPSHLPTFLP
jgi:hypothetical protein